MKPTITCLIQSSCLVVSSIGAIPALAQIDIDGTTATKIASSDGSNFTIEDGDRKEGNLFHSFQAFSVPTGGSAFFNNDVDIVNIFSRVTGGNISNIDGLIQANGSANLFLINPAGIIFGANARLDIGGSFLGSTADSLLFEDGEFVATDGQNKPMLTINAPIGLGFRDNPQDLQVQGSSLEVKPNRTMALVGGDLVFTGGDVKIPILPEDFSSPSLPGGNIYAPSGRIELGSIATEGIVDIKSVDSGWELGYENIQSFGDIQLTKETTINASGEGGGSIQVQGSQVSLLDGSRIFSFTFNSQAGKNIIINAKDLLLENSSIAGTNSIAFTITFAEGNGGNLIVNATDSVRLLRTPDNNRFGTALAAESAGSGDAGNLTINTGKFIAFNGGYASTSSFGEGQAGNLTLNALESVELIGTRRDNNGNFISSGLFSFTRGSKDGGNLTINTNKLLLQDGGQVNTGTGSSGKGGILTVKALDSIKIIGTSSNGLFSSAFRSVTFGDGKAGEIKINTGQLILQDGGQVSVSTSGDGDGGNLVVHARDSIKIIGTGKNNSFPSALFAASRRNGDGDGGNIEVTTTDLSLTKGGQISVSTFDQGDSGVVKIRASGNISIEGESPDGVRTSGVFSTVGSNAIGNSLGIDITANNLSLKEGGRVDASTFGQGDSGNLTVAVSESIELVGSGKEFPSGLFANAVEGNGKGGSLTITTDKLTVRDSAVLTVGNFQQVVEGSREPLPPGTGAAGNLEINARSVKIKNQGKINADNANGIGGELILNAESLTLRNKASISSSTTADIGQGGEVTLTINDNLQMQSGSSISAKAESTANGGNVTIDAKFIIASPRENNDIIAIAEEGTGGNITIKAEGLFGLEERSSTPTNNTNDIDASSQFGLDGNVTINVPDIGSLQETIEAPQIAELQTLGMNACAGGGTSTSNFNIIGRGGVPSQMTAPLSYDTISVEGENIAKAIKQQEQIQPLVTAQGEIYPARGIVFKENGDIVLTAYPTNTVQRIPESLPYCRQS